MSSYIDKLCPCRIGLDSTLSYEDCCKPLHDNLKIAGSPEQLMRSRFSAFYKGIGQYIFDTVDKQYRGNDSISDFTQSAQSTDWCSLEVVSFDSVSEQDTSGTVEFKAHFIDNEKLHCLHEVSNFVKVGEQWLYTDGRYQPRQTIKISRNDPCPCYSGKKAKKCHLS